MADKTIRGPFGSEKPITDKNVGTVAAGSTVVEYGDGVHHQTVITVDTTIAAIVTGAHDYGVLVYTLPTSAQIINSAYMSMALNSAAADISADTPTVGVGTVMGAGTNGDLSAPATEDDIIVGTAAANCNGTATVLTVADQILVIETGSAHEVNFNFAATWTSGGDLLCVVKGTIIIDWTFVV